MRARVYINYIMSKLDYNLCQLFADIRAVKKTFVNHVHLLLNIESLCVLQEPIPRFTACHRSQFFAAEGFQHHLQTSFHFMPLFLIHVRLVLKVGPVHHDEVAPSTLLEA